MNITEAAFEFTIEKFQQTIKRLVIAIVVLVIMFVGIVGGIVYAFIHYERGYVTELYEVNADEGNANYNYIGKSGDIINGEGDSN